MQIKYKNFKMLLTISDSKNELKSENESDKPVLIENRSSKLLTIA